jgi:anthranilate phosphoribosyltransferase
MWSFKSLIAKVAEGSPLTKAEAYDAFGSIFSGTVTPTQLGGFLMALRVRGETVEEVVGAVEALRTRMLRVTAPADAIDIVGTGGDGHGTYNISTLAALIVASCGVPVAKHGNRAASSKSGASDVLAEIGVKVGLEPCKIEQCLGEAGIAFMSAPVHHPGMRQVASGRIELGTRTIFNLLGPLANPASVSRQVVGVFARGWVEPVARVLRELGSKRAWVVHGSDGLDEITTTGPTYVTALENGEFRSFEIVPEDAGLARVALADLKGGDAVTNAAALLAVLDGARTPYRDIAVFNAAAALVVGGVARDLFEGARMASRAIDEGHTAATLAALVEVSNRATTSTLMSSPSADGLGVTP